MSLLVDTGRLSAYADVPIPGWCSGAQAGGRVVAVIVSFAGLGAHVRAARKRRGLTQAELSARAGVSRQWLVRLERGESPRAELGLVLAVLGHLGLEVHLTDPREAPGVPAASSSRSPLIDAVLARCQSMGRAGPER